jgi:hypothetical protein
MPFDSSQLREKRWAGKLIARITARTGANKDVTAHPKVRVAPARSSTPTTYLAHPFTLTVLPIANPACSAKSAQPFGDAEPIDYLQGPVHPREPLYEHGYMHRFFSP